MRITQLGRIIRTAERGEAVDFDKYDSDGRPNPYHGWTLDFPEHVPQAERTYSNKERAQGWYDDPENEPLSEGTQWRGTGDYADKAFHTHTQQYNRELDPNREILDPSGALGQYSVGTEDLNEYHERGHYLRPGNQTGYPEGSFTDQPGTEQRGIYSTRPDLNPWPGMEREEPSARPARRYTAPPSEDQGYEDIGRVFGLWHGGSSYSHGDPHEDMESFPSLEHARRAVEGRYHNYDTHHEGQRVTYDPETGNHYLTGDHHGSNLETPAVDRTSHMEIYQAHANDDDEDAGWRVNLEDGPMHHIWINADGDAVVGREHGDYGPDYDHDDEGEDWSDEERQNEEEQGSHPKQQHLTDAGFEYRPHEYNGDRYVREDHNGHRHVVRAPNPGYGAMDTWHYEFHPSNEAADRDPYAPRDASVDGPRSLSFAANDPEEAWNLHQNLSNDLSELASRGWGTHSVNLGQAGTPGNAREDNRATGVSNHTIEAHRRDADGSGYDRLLKTPYGWASHHVPDPTSTDRFPQVTTVAQGRSRRDVLDQADHHDARSFLGARADLPSLTDEASGAQTWQIPDRHIGTDYYNVQTPGEGSHSPRWVVTHNSTNRGIVNHTSFPNWAGLRDYITART